MVTRYIKLLVFKILIKFGEFIVSLKLFEIMIPEYKHLFRVESKHYFP